MTSGGFFGLTLYSDRLHVAAATFLVYFYLSVFAIPSIFALYIYRVILDAAKYDYFL